MKQTSKPDKLSHLKKSLEIASIILNAKDYIPTDEILKQYSQYKLEETSYDESTIKRSIKTISLFLGFDVFEGKSSKGYKLKEEYSTKLECLLPLFSSYLFLSEIESINFIFEPLPFYLQKKSLYYLYLFQYSKNYRKPIEFSYIKYLETDARKRKIHVYSLKIRGRKLYVVGKDTAVNELRHYLFTQITEIHKIYEEETFQPPNKEYLDNLYNDSIEGYEGPKPQKVVLRVAKESEIFIEKEYFHRSQKFSRDENGHLYIYIEANNSEDLFFLVSRFMDSIEIIEPANWREKYIQNLKKALQLNGE